MASVGHRAVGVPRELRRAREPRLRTLNYPRDLCRAECWFWRLLEAAGFLGAEGAVPLRPDNLAELDLSWFWLGLG